MFFEVRGCFSFVPSNDYAYIVIHCIFYFKLIWIAQMIGIRFELVLHFGPRRIDSAGEMQKVFMRNLGFDEVANLWVSRRADDLS